MDMAGVSPARVSRSPVAKSRCTCIVAEYAGLSMPGIGWWCMLCSGCGCWCWPVRGHYWWQALEACKSKSRAAG